MNTQRTFAATGNTMAEPTNDPDASAAVAAYVATLSNELASMARRTGLDTLGYLLEIVHLEAESVIRPNGTNDRRSR